MGAALPPRVSSAIERFKALLMERFGMRLRQVVLFGSWARGEATEESDVDLLVVIDNLSPEERREVHFLAYQADAVAEELVLLSPLAYSTEQAEDLRARERRLLRDIDTEGVPL